MAQAFQITGQRKMVGRLPDGTFGDVVRVDFTITDTATPWHVDVPVGQYNASNVAKAVMEAIDTHKAVHGL